MSVSDYRSFPIGICLAIWRSQNESIFHNCSFPLEQVFYRFQICYEEQKGSVKKPTQRQIGPLVIDETGTQGFFDCASQENPGKCRVGGCLFFNPSHVIYFSLGLGLGSNNWVEVSTLAALHRIAIEKQVVKFQIHSDSKISIDWLNCLSSIQNVGLEADMNQIIVMRGKFQSVSFTHIFRELNNKADSLAKAGVSWRHG